MTVYDELAQLGFTKVTIPYYGSNDEGWIEDAYGEPAEVDVAPDLFRKLQGLARDLLEEHYGGWEINEGSTGDIVTDTVQRKTFLNHGWIVETTQPENKEV